MRHTSKVDDCSGTLDCASPVSCGEKLQSAVGQLSLRPVHIPGQDSNGVPLSSELGYQSSSNQTRGTCASGLMLAYSADLCLYGIE